MPQQIDGRELDDREIAGQAPRGWYHGWTIVVAMMISQVAANCLTYNSFSLFLKGWSGDLRVPVSTLLLAITAMIFVAAPMSPIIGTWADRYPARRLFGFGLVGMALFYIGVSYATHAWQIIALYGLVAAPTLTMSTAVSANTLISRWFVRRIGLALGLSAFGIGLGGVVAPPIVAWLLPLVGWRLVWRGMGVLLAVVVMPLILLVLRDRPDPDRDGLHYLTPDGEIAVAPPGGHGAPAAGLGTGPQIAWREVLSRRNFWVLVATYLLIMSAGSAFIQNIAPLAASRGFGPSASGLLLSAVGASHVVATLLMGLAADRFGNRLPLAALALAVAAGIAVLMVAHSLPMLLLGAALIGINAAVFTPLAAGIATEFGAEGFGRAFGAAMLFLPLGTPAAVAVAKSQEHFGSYLPALSGALALLALAVCLCLLLREKGRGGRPK